MMKHIERIRKLLNLSKSANANEAAAALRQAQGLMKKHGLSLDEVELAAVSNASVVLKTKKPPEWAKIMANTIGRAFGTEPIYGYEIDRKNFTLKCRISFVGISPNDEISTYCYDVLSRQLMEARKNFIDSIHGNCKKQTKTARADWYCVGWISEVYDKVSPLSVTVEHQNLIQRWMLARGVVEADIATTKKKLSKDSKASDCYYTGKDDAKNININAPLDGKETEKLCLK